MRLRHSNMLAQANFLQTTTEPRLVSRAVGGFKLCVLRHLQFYKPWDVLPEQKDRIDRQIEDAQASVDEEADDFERSRAEEDIPAPTSAAPDAVMEDNGTEDTKTVGSEESAAHVELADSHAHKNGDTNLAPPNISSNGSAEENHGAPVRSSDLAKEVAEENQGETVVEAAEDTIIY
jgi:hypothetical protein